MTKKHVMPARSNMVESAKEQFIVDKNISEYLCMINDRWRNKFFYRALKKHAQDKVVLDVGTGTGILAFYALRHGAKFVYCVEQNDYMAVIAHRVLSQNFDRSRFKVIKADFWTSDMDGKIDQSIDILVSETVGPGLFDQGMLLTWSSARPYLSKNAISIPDRLHCDIWFWDQTIDANHRKNDSLFLPKETLDQDFAQSLSEAGRLSNGMTHWLNINQIKQEPRSVKLDIVDYTLENTSLIDFSDRGYPQIEFDAEIPPQCTMSIINKISFEDQILYLKDAKYMPWKYAPHLFFENPGKYRFTYNNLGMKQFMSATEWTYQIISVLK
jgi:hypothetical protein